MIGLNMNVLHEFMDTARAYLDLARKQATLSAPHVERRHISRLHAVGQATLLEIECRKNTPA